MDFYQLFDITQVPYFAAGLVSGVASGLFGIGGGMIIVPTMLVFGASSQHAVAISVVQMIFASIFGSYLNHKRKNLNLKDGIMVGFGGLFGASFSGELLKILSDVALTSLFLAVSFVFFIKYAFFDKKSQNAHMKNGINKGLVLFCAGGLTGIFAISLGIGGGLLIAPILAHFLGYDSKKIVPIALFFVIPASIAGAISFYNAGVIDNGVLKNGVSVGVASMIGVFLGIKIIEKLKDNRHKKLLLYVYALSISMTIFSLLRKVGVIGF